jgi:tetratricopeptide (TPR) repeat protein
MRLTFVFFAACVAACGAVKPPPPPPPPHGVLRPSAREAFDKALAAFKAHDQAGDWTPARCREVAEAFDAAFEAQGRTFAAAAFDAGTAFERCGDDAQARVRFEQAARVEPPMPAARVKAAVHGYKAGGDIDKAIASVEGVITRHAFWDAPSLVELATLQMTRDAAAGSAACKDDRDCARLNLQRALAIDDTYMPALNQLALLYLKIARHDTRGAPVARRVSSGVTRTSGHVQQLELAALVCSQAARKDPSYAPIHNTAGLVMVELGQTNAAVESFATATRLDPRLFEAHMNLAALNLSFRGFDHAERAYRRALELRPNDYDAHIGLAVALRGPVTGSEPDLASRIAAVKAVLARAQKIDRDRPEAYFNMGVLEHELGAAVGAPKPELLAAYGRAESQLGAFLEKARGHAEYEGASTRARERLGDIASARAFVSAP